MNKCFFRVLPTYLVFIFSLSGWVTSVFLYKETRQHQHFVQEGKLTNPFNILKFSLTDLSSESEIYRKIQEWSYNESNAQLGSLKTICTYNPRMLTLISPVICKTAAIHVCNYLFELEP
ncbi:hypothetical protein [Vibrio owensii]|uniref:hypothetical protein n=1 Tax=Vibrio owensii TaxID=696485 RepID=UPI00215D21A7|nr:hypothetical protein [Vibrio owensii]MCR9939792.1 hypothetical protein [Vibrio owensii]